MVAERQRLQEQIRVIDRELGYSEQRMAIYRHQSLMERRDHLVRMVLQRLRLDEDSEGLEERVGR